MKLLYSLARSLGYELIRRKKNPSLRAHLRNVIHRHAIDVVIDVGANDGQFALLLRSEGFRGTIYSFEPVNSTYEQLRRIAQHDANWKVFNTALGERVGDAIINVTASSDLCSLLDPNDFGKTAFPSIAVSHQETIAMDTLDNFIAREKLAKAARILLKMDTQGYDLQVFQGAQQSLGCIVCLLSEISLMPIYAQAPHYLDALRLYEGKGFVPSGLYPVSRNDDLSVIEMDCVLINNALAQP